MDEWPTVPLGDLAEFASGGTPSMSEPSYWDGDIPWISAASLTQPRLASSDRNVTQAAIGNGTKMAPAGSTLLLVRGMSLHKEIRVGRATRDLAFNQDVKSLRPRPNIDEAFLFYALDGRRGELLHMVHSAGHGTGVLATDRLKGMLIALPEIDEQRRIAGVLGALDDLIETTRSLLPRLEDAARILAARAGSETALSAMAAVASGKQAKPVGTVEHYSLPAFDAGVVPEIADANTIKSSKLRLCGPTVLVSRLNPRWERCWMAYSGDNAMCSTEFVPLIGRATEPEEIWAVTSSNAFWDQMRALVTGTTGSHQRVDKDAVLTLMVPDVRQLPGADRQHIVDLVRGARDAREEIAELTRARDELLPLLMSGRVRVREVA